MVKAKFVGVAVASAALTSCMPHGMHRGWPGGIIGLIILVLDIVAIVHIVQSPHSSNYKLLWVIVILLLPLVGLILWWVLKDKKI